MPNDILANAQLTPEQRQAVKNLEGELSGARQMVKQLEARIAKLEEQAASEQSVLTRPEFNREVGRMLAYDERYGGTSSVLYFDFASLDGLAARYDQRLADEVVQNISRILMHHVRRSDIVGRLAADEFGVLLVRCDNENAWKKGRELAAILTASLDTADGKKLGLDISFGAYTFREEEDAATGIKEAAEAVTKIEGK
jgi:diguanylate cyclase (GGDEF)-like protein